MRRPLIALSFLAALSAPLRAQLNGGNGEGQASPVQVPPGGSDAGALAGDVNLFTGVLGLSYGLGEVATLSGLSFPLELTHESVLNSPFDAPHVGGVPYGEGWTLGNAGISVEVHAFDHIALDQLPVDPQLGRAHSMDQSRQRGTLYWSNARLTLPGGGGGRLVYKYPDKEDPSVSVYHLAAFDSYIEARFNGSTWTVRGEDGTEFVFGLLQWRGRNAPQNTDNLYWNNARPVWDDVEPARWHLTEIRNPNHANGQKLLLDYHLFGRQETHWELRQAEVAQTLATGAVDFVHVATGAMLDSAAAHGAVLLGQQGDTLAAGDTAWWMVSGGLRRTEAVYRDVVLKAVSATDAQGMDMGRVELKYKSWRPEQELAGNAPALARGAFLLLSDPGVVRIDSLYSQKTVWFMGMDHALSANWHGPRPPVGTAQGFGTGWRRYMHPRAHQHPLSGQRFQNHPANPYAVHLPGGLAGLPPGWYLSSDSAKADALGNLDYLHSVLESPRIDGRGFPPGEWYELRTLTRLPMQLANSDMNIDLRVGTGLRDDHPHYSQQGGGQPPHAWRTLQGQRMRLGMENGLAGYWENGVEIYSTLRKVTKWNPAYAGQGSLLTTRDAFYLPNLPNFFGGFSVQVGPGADNMRNVPDASGDGYPAFYNNRDALGQPRDSFALRYGRWFGTGAPLEPLWRGDWHDVQRGAPQDWTKGQNGTRWQYWHHYYQGPITPAQLTAMGPNQPTALTREALKANRPWPGYAFGSLSGGQVDVRVAHEAAQSAELLNVELVRIGRNPWLLDSVVFMTPDKEQGRHRRVAAYTFEHSHMLVPVLNNYNPDADPALLALRGGDCRMAGGDTLYRNVYRLTAVRRHGCDTLGRVSAQAAGVSRIAYMRDDPGTRGMDEGGLVRAVWSELGGETRYVYDLAGIDTAHVNSAGYGSGQDLSLGLMGKGRTVEARVPVREVVVVDGNGPRSTRYTFSGKARVYKGYELDAHLGGTGWNFLSAAGYGWGYARAVVEQPPLAGAGRARTEHDHLTASASWEDRLLFGRMAETRSYDAQGRLVSRSGTEWRANPAYLSGHDHLPSPPLAGAVHTGAWPVLAGEPAFAHHRVPQEHLMSWFVHVASTRHADFEAADGDSIVHLTEYGYYDWDTGRVDLGGEYSAMYRSVHPGYNFFEAEPYFIGGANPRFSHHAEPSWQVAWVRHSSPDRPGASTRQDFYYLWDIEPFLRVGGVPGAPAGLERFEGSHRPFWLCRRHGIRNTMYEEMGTQVEPGPGGGTSVSLSTWYEWDVFRDVAGDIVWEHDSTNHGRTCGDTLIDPVVDGRMGMVYCLGEGKPVEMERAVAETVDDPRYVEDSAGGWWKFEVLDFQTRQVDGASTAPVAGAGCTGGVAAKVDGSVEYFGELALAGGGSLRAGSLKAACRNYGVEGGRDSLTCASREKASLVCWMPHAHGGGAAPCDHVHGFLSDSAMAGKLKGQDSLPPGSGSRQLMIDMLDWQYMLRAVYVQADTAGNHYTTPDSVHFNEFQTRHNLWDSSRVATPWHGSTHRWVMRPGYPAICVYRVHERNMHGLVVDESDARHAHTLHEYGKGRVKSWWDLCGRPHSRMERAHPGLPLSVTVTDFGLLEHVTKYRYAPNNALAAVISPNGELSETLYDTEGRPALVRLAGHTRQELAYGQWAGDTLQGWDQRTGMNYVQARQHFGLPGQAAFTTARAYSDPLGRNAQSFVAVKGQASGWDKRFAGAADLDGWGRVEAAHKPYFKAGEPSLAYDPVVPPLPAASLRYEEDGRSRPLRGAGTGLPVNGPHVAKARYEIITVSRYKAETGLDWTVVKAQYPTLAVNGIPQGGGVSINRDAGPGHGRDAGTVRLYKNTVDDADGRRSVSYADADGRLLATLGYTTLDSGTWSQDAVKVVTAWLHDAQGRVRTVVDPGGLRTETSHNLLGWAYKVETPDAGLSKLMYNQAGDVLYAQDAVQRQSGKVTAFGVDRLGRVHSVAEVTLGAVPAGGSGQLSLLPLAYKDTLGLGFRSIHTVVDALARTSADCNCSPAGTGAFTSGYGDRSWACADFPEVLSRRVLETRWDYSADTALGAPATQVQLSGAVTGPAGWAWDMAGGLRHARLAFVDAGGARAPYVGRSALTRSYDPSGMLVELAWTGFDAEGRTIWLARQFRAGGITLAQQGEAHVVRYGGHHLDGMPAEVVVDLGADGSPRPVAGGIDGDWAQVYARDPWGRVQAAGWNPACLQGRAGAGVWPVASYAYEEASGAVAGEVRWAANPACAAGQVPVPGWLAAVPVDTVAWTRDVRGQLTGIRSRFMDMDIRRGGADPNAGAGAGGVNLSGPAQVRWQEHWAGGINGWKVQYKAGGGGVQAGAVPGAAEGWQGATVYGFTHDGLGRLTEADASVLSQPFTGGAGWGGGGFGTPLMSTRPAWHGDEQYAHDKAGNLTGLRRHHCYRPNQPLPLGAKGDNWTYQYAAGTNRLASLKTGGVVQGGFTYGATGALASDSRRGVAVAQAELGGLPTRLTVGGVQVVHVYGAGGRVHKSAGGGQGEYYLRGAGGGVLAVHREADSVWAVQLHGLGPVAEVELPDPVRDSTAGDTLGGGGGVNRVARPRGAAVRVLLRQALAVAGVAALEGLLPEAAPPGAEGAEGGDGRGAAGLVRVPAVRALLWPGLAGLLEGRGLRPPKGGAQPPRERRMDADSTWLPVLKFIVMDHLGNVRVAYRAWRDSASCAPRAALASLMDYTPHGRLLRAWAAPGAGAERWQSTLHERDAETGWDHRGARLYDADYGRFISVDPLADAFPSSSPYSYVLGEPTTLTDPTGTAPEGCCGGGGGNPPINWAATAKTGMIVEHWNRSPMDDAHDMLDLAGMVPLLGEPADGLNGALYTLEGRFTEAGFSYGGMLPVAGWASTGGKWAYKALRKGDEVVEIAVAKVDDLKEAGEEVAEGKVEDMEYLVTEHGKMPSPRPGFESHHGVMSAYMKAKNAGYNPDKAVGVLLKKIDHQATFAVFNKWKVGMAEKAGGKFSWDNVSEDDIYGLAEQMFNSANVPMNVRAEYWRQFNQYKKEVK